MDPHQLSALLNEKKAELAMLKEKTELQTKKIKLFRKENEELRNAHARQTQIDADLLLASKELLDSNSSLQTQIARLQQDIKHGIEIGVSEESTVEAVPRGPIMIRNSRIDDTTSEVDFTGLALEDEEFNLLRPYTNIRAMCLADNKLSDPSVSLICKHFRKLEKLQLNNNRLTSDGLAQIKNLTCLRVLELRNNNLGQAWLPALEHLINLQQLSLSKNRIGSKGASCLASLINLRYLDITNNDIDDLGAAELAKLKKLTSLYLMSNKLTVKGAEILFNGLSSIQVFDLRFNTLDQSQKDHLKTIIPPTMTQMFL